MNPAEGSEVREVARFSAERIIARLNGGLGDGTVPSLCGDVREAYVAAFCAELMAAEGITLKRLRAAMAPESVRS